MSNCFVDFIQNKGLYEHISVSSGNINELIALLKGECKFDLYCERCGEKRVFNMNPINKYCFDHGKSIPINIGDELARIQHSPHFVDGKWVWNGESTEPYLRVFQVYLTCTMDTNHHVVYILMTKGDDIFKIGQYPSIADFSFKELNEYDHELDKASRRELGRAIGLFADGIGIGSYVYLRRVFERILEKAYKFASEDGVVISEFNSLRVAERINALKDYLPDMIVDNPKMYSVISKGIHELSEEDCLKYFPVLKECIEMILIQWEEKRRLRESRNKLEASLSKIVTELSTPS